MQARDEFLTHILMGPKQFLIPIFQRTYSWPESHCNQLYKDVLHVGKTPVIPGHFIGSVVLAPNEQANNASIPQWLVIDGQQRLTTFTLLIIALIRRADELGMQSVGATALAAIKDYYIANGFGQGEARFKLLLTQYDRQTLNSLIDGKTPAKPVSDRVVENFIFFCEQLIDVETVELLYAGLKKIKIVEVMLNSQDDPQAIFESLNSTGLDLSQADLIRNYILMRHKHGEQTRLYQDIWFPMEQLFSKQPPERFDRFMQDFLTLETASNSLIKSRDVYPLFKQWFLTEINASSAQAALERMYTLAGYYSAYMFGQEEDKRLARSFSRLRRLIEVAAPVVMRFYEAYAKHGARMDDFVQAVDLLESYVLRRSICAMQTRSLGNVFATIAQRIDLTAPLESLKVTFARFQSTNRFPSDKEFFEQLCKANLYEKKGICKFVLDRLENNSKEMIDTSNFSIEHVMPQNKNLNADWKRMLGDDWVQIQQDWLHRLGNLTLTGYNPEYKDSSFTVKKSIANGFDMSPLRLNRFMATHSDWTAVQMKKRGELLAKQALGLWGPLDIDEAIVRQYRLQEIKRRGENSRSTDLLQPQWLPLFEQLSSMITLMDDEVTCVVSKRNISFYTLDPFIQVIDRRNGIGIVLAIDYEDLAPEWTSLVKDSNLRTFRNVDLSGVLTVLTCEADVHAIKPIIQAALDLAQQ
ncbi:DUF262 domain-containing protein [Alcaligenaceae bacterium]|nr:DUF262 domain-containing protein [Alcaligenaceae bacterium]